MSTTGLSKLVDIHLAAKMILDRELARDESIDTLRFIQRTAGQLIEIFEKLPDNDPRFHQRDK